MRAWTGPREAKRFQSLLTTPSALWFETSCVPLVLLQGFVNEVALDLVDRDGCPMPVLLCATARRGGAGEFAALHSSLRSLRVFSFGVLAYQLLTGKLPFAEPPLRTALVSDGALPFESLDRMHPISTACSYRRSNAARSREPTYRTRIGKHAQGRADARAYRGD